MQYMLLIYSSEADHPEPGSDAFKEVLGEFMALTEDVKAKGVHRAAEGLKPVATATTVRVREGRTLTTDGPFAETKEQLGGFYLLDCANLDEALEYAARIPSARFGAVEVRPVAVYG